MTRAIHSYLNECHYKNCGYLFPERVRLCECRVNLSKRQHSIQLADFAGEIFYVNLKLIFVNSSLTLEGGIGFHVG